MSYLLELKLTDNKIHFIINISSIYKYDKRI